MIEDGESMVFEGSGADGGSAAEHDGTSRPGHVIVIVGSAGALLPLRRLVRALGSDIDAAVVVTIHSLPEQPTLLPEILSKDTSLRVSMASPGEVLRSGHLYVAPPGYHHVLLEDGRFRLRPHRREAPRGASADPLLTSAARDFGERAIGVVLSGANQNGAAGVQAIRAAGGEALAQDPTEAGFSNMPLAAVRAGVDLCAGVDVLGHHLAERCAIGRGRLARF